MNQGAKNALLEIQRDNAKIRGELAELAKNMYTGFGKLVDSQAAVVDTLSSQMTRQSQYQGLTDGIAKFDRDVYSLENKVTSDCTSIMFMMSMRKPEMEYKVVEAEGSIKAYEEQIAAALDRQQALLEQRTALLDETGSLRQLQQAVEDVKQSVSALITTAPKVQARQIENMDNATALAT